MQINILFKFITSYHYRAVCNCPKADQDGTIKRVAMEYSKAVEELVASGRYDTHDGFTAVFQPFLRDVDVPRLVSILYYDYAVGDSLFLDV